MFDNIGGKMKRVAEALGVIGIIVSVVYAFMLWMGKGTLLLGIGTLLGGCAASWIVGACLYGFGELIEETQKNRRINHTLLYIVAKVASGEQVKVNVKLEE